MKTSHFLVLSLALSATALFAQNTASPAAPYSSISQYPAPAATAPLADKTIELVWKTTPSGDLYLDGQDSVTLKKGQNLIVSIQNPNISHCLPSIGTSYRLNSAFDAKQQYYDFQTDVSGMSLEYKYQRKSLLTGGGESRLDDASREPIIFNFQPTDAVGSVITCSIDSGCYLTTAPTPKDDGSIENALVGQLQLSDEAWRILLHLGKPNETYSYNICKFFLKVRVLE